MLAAMARRTAGSPVGEALSWASRIIAVGIAMFLPATLGAWADAKLGTRLLAPAGLVIGFTAGLTWLIRMTSRQGPR